MEVITIALLVITAALFAVLLTAFICFYIVFFVPKEKRPEEEYPIPPGEIYEPYREIMVSWMKEVRQLPHERIHIRSFDGLTLCGRYYEYADGAPIELMFHGYRGKAERDLCGGVQRAFSLGRNVLIVDQRGCGNSEGCVITFGVNESKDCVSWVDYLVKRFPKTPIILTGISMGAATVMMATAKPLPDNVVGVLADCGYTSAKAIIQTVMRTRHLPVGVLYPFVKLGARLFGRFDLEKTPPIEAMKSCRLPIIFFHGANDDFVPCDMSVQNYEACGCEKRLVIVPKAGHGLSYLVTPEAYLNALREFTFGL